MSGSWWERTPLRVDTSRDRRHCTPFWVVLYKWMGA
jgi:hypothetical protein